MISVLDASVVIRFLNKEKGWEKILEIIEGETCMSSVNVTEFYTWWVRNGGDIADAILVFDQLEIEVVAFDMEIGVETAKIYPQTKQFGLSLGDRACLCLARKLNAKIYTCDKIWNHLEAGFEVVVV